MTDHKQYEGFVDIEFRKVNPGSEVIAFPEAIVREVSTGELILTATDLHLHLDPDHVLYIELECLVGEDGNWLREGKPTPRPAVTRLFRWLVRSVNTTSSRKGTVNVTINHGGDMTKTFIEDAARRAATQIQAYRKMGGVV